MKLLIYFILIFLLTPLVYADSCDKSMQNMAKLLQHKNNTKMTVFEIDRYLHNTNNYTFFWYAQDRCKYWKTRKGDCTDITVAQKFMLDSLGIKTRYASGYSDKFYQLHDWIEFQDNGKWYTIESIRFPELKKRNNRLW
jgi:transglutaminase-like putative cysteine protease